MAEKSFSAQVDAWARKSEERLRDVFQMASTEVIEEMRKPVGAGGSMPVVSGFLRNSLQVALNADLPAADRKPTGSAGAPQDVHAVIAGAEIGDTISAGYTAIYALRINYGFQGEDSMGRTYNQQGRLFVEKAVQQWPAIVSSVVARLKNA